MQENGVAGDLVMVLRQKKHGEFTRKGDDLVYEHELSLAEALCGFQFVITHLDGRRLLVSGAGEVIRPGQLKAIDGEGMPVHGMPFARGTLYVAFRVAFPCTVTPALRDAVAAAFPAATAAKAAVEDGGWCEETTTRDVGEEEEMKLNAKGEQSPTTRMEHGGGGAGGEDEYVHVHVHVDDDDDEDEEM